MQDHNVNFYEVQDSFNEHWDGKSYERGKGYKQYKRWEYFMEQRTYPSGNRLNTETLYKEWKNAKKSIRHTAKSDSEWESVGPIDWVGQGWNPGLGRVNAVIEDPNNQDILYVATPSGGLWKSEDGGDSWIVLTDNLPAIGASGLAIDPENSNLMYLATGDGNANDTYSLGVMKTEDGGETWSPTNLSFEVSDNIRCSKILMDPSNSSRLYVATHNGLYVTADAGESWNQPIDEVVRDIEFKPGDPSIVYVSGRRFYRSENFGESFDQVTDGTPSFSSVNRLAIAVSAASPEHVYMVASSNEDSGFQGLYKSSDSGQSFSLQSDSPNILTYSEIGDGIGGQGWYDLAIAAHPDNEDEIYVGGINVWQSLDGGETWNIKSHWVYPSNIGYTHADIHSLDFYGDRLYCGSDGGVFRYQESIDEWLDLSEGLQISQFYRIAVSTTNPDLILTASQDNGTNIFSENGTYIHLLGGDGNAAAIDYTDDDIMYSAYPGGNFQRSTDGGNSFSGFTNGIDESGAWVTPLEFHPENPSILFAAYENVWKNTGGVWSKISDLPISGTLRSLEIAPSDPDVIYTGGEGFIYRTIDGGESWNSISGNLPDLYITDIEASPDDPLKVWVTCSGYEEGNKVFYSEDGNNVWENISQNLPNVPVNCISYQLGTNDGIYIGTDIGVYYKSDDLFSWSFYNEGLPNVIINQILFQYSAGKLIVGTYGRGVWQNDFFNAGEALPIADFDGSPELICEGESVTYLNQSLNVSDSLTWTFEGGTPSTSNEVNPTVTYNESGVFDAKIWVANANGEDSLVLENFVEVLSQTGIPSPYSESFEGVDNVGEASWYVENADQDLTWQISADQGYLSAQSVWIENYNSLPITEDRLQSTTIDLSQLDTAIVTMRVAYAEKSEQSTEWLRVSISNDCGEDWTFKELFTSTSDLPSTEPTDDYFIPSGPDDWKLLTINNINPEERTENFRLQLAFWSNGGNNIYVDDINIIDEPILTTENIEIEKDVVEIYPNPNNTGFATLKLEQRSSSNIQIEIYDAAGKKLENLWSGELPAGNQTLELDLAELSQGVYTLRAVSSDRIRTGKIIIIE